MARHSNPHLNWDELLNGTLHTVNLDAIGFAGGVNDLRALAYREADRRRCTVATHKRNPLQLQIQARHVCTCASSPHLTSCRLYIEPRSADQHARADANAGTLDATFLAQDPAA